MEEQDYFEALSLEGPEAGSAPAQVEAETAGLASDEDRAPAEAPEGMPPETEQAIRAARRRRSSSRPRSSRFSRGSA